MKSFIICLIAAAGLTLGLEGALGNPAAPAATAAPVAYQGCDKLQGTAYTACEEQEKTAPLTKPAPAPSSSYGGGDYGY
jgi:hypothetical protein